MGFGASFRNEGHSCSAWRITMSAIGRLDARTPLMRTGGLDEPPAPPVVAARFRAPSAHGLGLRCRAV
jgi:hypothetical protein